MRAECLIEMGEMGKAISDLKATSKLKNDNTQAFYKLSTIYYTLGDHEMSLKWDTFLTGDEWACFSGIEAFSHRFCSEVRECLKLDPDHKQCYSHYKQVRKLNKQILSAEELIQEQRWE